MASNKSRAFFSNSGWMMAQQIYSMLLLVRYLLDI